LTDLGFAIFLATVDGVSTSSAGNIKVPMHYRHLSLSRLNVNHDFLGSTECSPSYRSFSFQHLMMTWGIHPTPYSVETGCSTSMHHPCRICHGQRRAPGPYHLPHLRVGSMQVCGMIIESSRFLIILRWVDKYAPDATKDPDPFTFLTC